MTGRIGVARGTTLYVGAVLGPGVLILPALAMHAAGPASLLAWAAMLAVSVPIAAAFAALGMRYPDTGGVATFTRRAFGPAVGTVVGWWFYAAVPLGMVAGALAGGRYAATALGWGPAAAGWVSAGVLGLAYVMNLFGLHVSGRVHLALTGGLFALLATVVAVSLPHVAASRFEPFAPQGLAGIGSAAAVLFVAVCGWEAAANLAGEFTRPRKQLPVVAAASLSIIALLYAGLAICTVGVLGASGGDTEVPLILLLDPAAGPGAMAVTALCALLLTFGALFTFIAAASRAGAALGRDGALPRWLAANGVAGVPRRSLGLQASAAAAVGAAALGAPSLVDVDLLMRAFSVVMASVTLLGLAAAVRLLSSAVIRTGAAAAAVVVGAVAAFGGRLVILPVVVAAAAWAWHRRHPRPPAPPVPATRAKPAVRATSERIQVLAGNSRQLHDRLASGAHNAAPIRSRPRVRRS
ncbi:amino acid permease [Micromonospora sp. WMMD1155]|uniref:APC family permease n=1 Tax=Micromonospora sp. WMMD1155 TaxID=3016094 RepID=UPI00249AEF5E|nr:amino acid permease [Micromonospora sp. WMMD1155]WFE52982.1 amino acid permease [Micromonospora sp. WMMD1155]